MSSETAEMEFIGGILTGHLESLETIAEALGDNDDRVSEYPLERIAVALEDIAKSLRVMAERPL